MAQSSDLVGPCYLNAAFGRPRKPCKRGVSRSSWALALVVAASAYFGRVGLRTRSALAQIAAMDFRPSSALELPRRAIFRAVAVATGASSQMPRATAAVGTAEVSTGTTQVAAGRCARAAALVAARQDEKLAAALVRLAFHDAATGADGSVRFELERSENVGPSLRAALRSLEPVVRNCGVSWADAIAIGGAAAVEATGGPFIEVRAGRTDAQRPGPEGALPDPGFNGPDISAYFRKRGLSDEEAVAMCGAHTLGRWTSFQGVYKTCLAKDSDQKEFWKCTREEGERLPFTTNPGAFNTEYFQALVEYYQRKKLDPPPTVRWKDRKDIGTEPRLNLLPSDNALIFDDRLRPIVQRFAVDELAFFAAFARAYTKLIS